MGFLSPSAPAAPTPPNSPVTATAPGSTQTPSQAAAAASLISTSGQGVLNAPNQKRSSLLGGSV